MIKNLNLNLNPTTPFHSTLGWITVGFTFILMTWGNIVSSTGSGLACPDWPLCHGTISPELSTDVFLEWGHRVLAFISSVLILFTLYQIFKKEQKKSSKIENTYCIHPALKRSGKILIFLLSLQILLGGTTVLLGLSPILSTLHLMIASLVFGGLILLACAMTWREPEIPHTAPKLKRLVFAGLISFIIQLVLGALTRHYHAGLACPKFPLCLSGFFPIPFTLESALAFTHRWWGVLMLGLFLHIAIQGRKTAIARTTRQIFGLATAQVFLGIGTVLSLLNTHSRAIHATLGYALWGMLVYVTIRTGSLRFLWSKK